MDRYVVIVRLGPGSSVSYCDIDRQMVNTVISGLKLTDFETVEIRPWADWKP